MSTKSFTTDFSFNAKSSEALVTAIEHSSAIVASPSAKKTFISVSELADQLGVNNK